ncbi:MAG: type IV secretion protein DotI [Legionellales bacterium]|nr:type IV secretion protein DotI [Legionellales bacterium]|tara:strand:- start:1063 stop:1683 length:621 start_codon:yes stop_codon:yes gene_type:complete
MEGYDTVSYKKEFYKKGVQFSFLIAVASVVLSCVLAAMVIYLSDNKPRNFYFAARSDGVIIPIQPLSQPVVSQSQLTAWASSAIISVFSYDYLRYRSQLQESQQFFSPDGWREFSQSLKGSGNLITVLQQKLLLSAVPTGSAVITKSGLLNRVFTWQIQMPILVTFQSASEVRSQSLLVNVQVSRVPVQNNPQGIAITRFVSTSQN